MPGPYPDRRQSPVGMRTMLGLLSSPSAAAVPGGAEMVAPSRPTGVAATLTGVIQVPQAPDWSTLDRETEAALGNIARPQAGGRRTGRWRTGRRGRSCGGKSWVQWPQELTRWSRGMCCRVWSMTRAMWDKDRPVPCWAALPAVSRLCPMTTHPGWNSPTKGRRFGIEKPSRRRSHGRPCIAIGNAASFRPGLALPELA